MTNAGNQGSVRTVVDALWHIIRWIVVSFLLIGTLAGGAYYWFRITYSPTVPKLKFPSPQTAAEAQRQDLEYFRNYLRYDRAYAPPARVEAERLLSTYETQAGKLSPVQFELAISRMVALADNGHSAVRISARRHNRIPCRFYRFGDGIFVLRARPQCRKLLGARVTAIDGRSIDNVLHAMYEFVRGPRNHYEQLRSVFFLESPELLHAAGLVVRSDRLTLVMALPDGSAYEQTLSADPPDSDGPRVYSDSYLSPQRLAGEANDWASLLDTRAELPFFLQDYAVPFRSAYWPAKSTYYIQFKGNNDQGGYKIGDFVKRVKREIAANKPRVIVLDMRFNQGGNFVKTARFMSSLAHLTDSIKRLYIFTSAWTFSAGEVSVALAKQHGADKAVIVGEPVGDRMRFWAEGGAMCLPNSQICMSFATGLHDYIKGCEGEPRCFVMLRVFPVKVTTLAPDVPVAYEFADYVKRRDPLLDRVMVLNSQP